MQDLATERAFYAKLFSENPHNEHITEGYEELHALALTAPPKGTVLDLGCGTGAHAVRIARRGHTVLAVDVTLSGVRAARDRFRGEGLRGYFVVADAERLPFGDESIAVTWMSLLLHHFPKLDALPAELARVTRHRIVAFEPNAQNFLTWLAFNIVNRFWGLSSTTPNQRALWPRRLVRKFRSYNFDCSSLHYIHREWPDTTTLFSFIRSAYRLLTSLLPLRFQANKFLVILDRTNG